MPTVAFHTLGCKVNQGETAAMAHLFRQAGYSLVEFDQPADVYIVNSCAVTMQAERKSRQMARRARERNRNALLVMAGCYPQVACDRLQELAEVDLLVGSAEKPRIVELVSRALNSPSPLIAVSQWTGETTYGIIGAGQEISRTRANLKIQDGCQQFCAYCIIPYARGPERSREPVDVRREVRQLIDQGFQEIVLTGIHIGSYGRDLQPKTDLASLIAELLPEEGLSRLRLSSIEPNEITAKLLRLMQQQTNFCRHLHVPLQAGEDRVLRAMNRRYTTDDYRRIIEQVRAYVPEVAITTDVIVGFPGETEEEFQSTYQFVQEIGFSRLHVFRYSRRPGTPAAELPEQVPAAEKERRSRQLIALGQEQARAYASRLLGQTVEVLWEHQQNGRWIGHTDTYVEVGTVSQQPLANQLLPTQVTGLSGGGVLGQLRHVKQTEQRS
jgi:threonylcarbamoyladenosine tRNA methylthiotransferase MtaB